MVWCIDKLLPRSEHRFLPVGAHNWQRVVYFSQVLLLMRCPLYLRLTHGDGVAHTRAREARINIMLIMRIRKRLKTIG